MFHVQHFVEQNVFNDELRHSGLVHAAIEQNLIRAWIVTTELATPATVAPTEMRSRQVSTENFPFSESNIPPRSKWRPRAFTVTGRTRVLLMR